MHSTGTYMPFGPTVSAALRENATRTWRREMVNAKNALASGQRGDRPLFRDRAGVREGVTEISVNGDCVMETRRDRPNEKLIHFAEGRGDCWPVVVVVVACPDKTDEGDS